ncbi:MAG: GNAT family N-acetyltransferase/peptidase C39 family protein [candidate division Zixibacteria bacterium]|nr:GNAT family N-acetyltransferase/peptidase C39 family protein [candidate division Zixibacteria bacterium]
MSSTVTIRPATTADLDALMALEENAFPTDRFTRRQYVYLLTRANADVLLAEIKHKIGGNAIMLWRRKSTTGRLYTIATDPSLQGRGIGTLLLGKCEEIAHKRRCKRIVLEVRENNHGAIGFYRRHGYAVEKRLPGYYGDDIDGLSMAKTLLPLRITPIHLKVPYYAQTLEFTCGSACIMMAMKYFSPDLKLNRLLEYNLWKESTLIFMTSGIGGIGPFGLAYTARIRNYRTRLIVSRDYSPFLSSTRLEYKRKVIELIHDDLKDKAIQAGVDVSYRNFTFEDIAEQMADGYLPIVLISTYHLHGDRVPHWVVMTGFDADSVYVHDPFAQEYEDNTDLARNIKIPLEMFRRMRRYGKNKFKSVLFVGPKDKS